MGTFSDLTNKPTTLFGFGITDAVCIRDILRYPGITIIQQNLDEWNEAYSWGDHNGRYRPIGWVPSWNDLYDIPGNLGGGSGSGGIVDHNDLNKLDYASAGHTGFASISSPIFTSKVTTPLLKVTTNAAAGKMLISDAGGDLSYLTAGATTQILVGNGAGNPVWTTATGTGAPVRAGSPTFTGTVSADIITTTGIITGKAFRTTNSNDLSLLIRRGGSNALYVQQVDATGEIASFRYNSATAGAGTEVMAIGHNLVTVNVPLIMSNNNYIGQTAGPTLTFDDTNNYLEITGCNVGFGFTAPLSKLAIDGGLHVGGESDAGDNNILLDGYIRSSVTPYVSQTTGWNISQEGAGDFRYLYTDELHAKAFIADLEQALAGGQIICKSVAPLAAIFTIPAAEANATLVVESFKGFDTFKVFVDGDIIRLRQFARTGTALNITNTWGTVVFVSEDTDIHTQTYTFTRSAAPNAGAATPGQTIGIGVLALDYGTTGNGFLESNAIDGNMAENSPYQQSVIWTGHPATGLTIKSRLGNLEGLAGYDIVPASPGYGLYSDNVYLRGKIIISNPSDIDQTTLTNAAAAGADVTATHQAASIAGQAATATSSDFAAVTGATKPANNATVGAIWGTNLTDIPGTLGAPAGSGLFLSATHMGYYTADAWKTFIKSDGTFAFAGDANNYVTWNGTTLAIKGNITATTGLIGGYTIGAHTLTTTGAGIGDSTQGYAFWAGSDTPASAEFSVTHAGAIKAESGVIGGWTLAATTLTGGSVTLSNTGYVSAGTGNDIAYMSAADGTYRFWAGNATAASAPFRVTKLGALTATGIAELGTAIQDYGGPDFGLAIKGSDIYENAYNGDNSVLHINRVGHAGTTDHYRICHIYDGKGNSMVQIGGGTPTALFGVTCLVEVGGIFQTDGVARLTDEVVIGGTTANAYAQLDLQSTTKAFIFPRMTAAAIVNLTPVAGMVVYQTDGTNGYYGYTNTWRRLD